MRIAQRVAASASLCAPQARASRSRSRAAPRRCVRAMATARFAIPQETLSKLGAAMKPIDSVFDMVKGAKVVLVGESSHGTEQFYSWRCELSKRLIEEAGFSAVCIEGDWPDTALLHSYVTLAEPSLTLDGAFEGFKSRFPLWMWRNPPVRHFVAWLRARNEPLPPEQRAGIFGLDVYSLNASMQAVEKYLQAVDPPTAEAVRAAYACFVKYGDDPQRYGRAAALGRHRDGCRGAAVAALQRVAEKTAAYGRVGDGVAAQDAAFSNEMNARVVVDAEKYYRAMFEFNESSWNIRDQHFDDTLYRVRDHMRHTRGSDKVVVWAHNSHLGDARATKTGADARGANRELNLGQLARESGGAAVRNVGQFTHEGTVTAARDWGEPHATRAVRPALPGSYEELLHAAAEHANRREFALDLHDDAVKAALDPLSPRLERAIGVIYRPETERQSHYFPAFLTHQFDVAVWHDVTRALPPLDAAEPQTPEPETFPSGL